MAQYEQTEMDLRSQLAQRLAEIAARATSDAQNAVTGTQPSFVRSRHEAYGIAAEHYGKAAASLKDAKDSMAKLLATPSNPAASAVEAVSSLCSSSETLAMDAILMAAEMRRVLDNLYVTEEAEEADTDNNALVLDSGMSFPDEDVTGAFEEV